MILCSSGNQSGAHKIIHAFFLLAFLPSTHPIYFFLNTTDFIDNLLDRSQEEIGKREKVTRTLLKHEKERRQRTNKNTYGQRNTVELPIQVRFLKQQVIKTISNKSHSSINKTDCCSIEKRLYCIYPHVLFFSQIISSIQRVWPN